MNYRAVIDTVRKVVIDAPGTSVELPKVVVLDLLDALVGIQAEIDRIYRRSAADRVRWNGITDHQAKKSENAE